MIWYICFTVCLVLLGITGKLAFTKRLGTMRLVFVMAGFFAAAFTIYIPVFFMEYRFVSALFGNLLNTVLVITMEADYLEAYSSLQSEFSSNPLFVDAYHVALALLHIGLPAVSAMTAITVIVKWFTQLRLRVVRRGRRALHVFSEVNYNSKMLAADIRKNDPKCTILFLEENNDMDHSEIRESLNCTVLYESIESVCADASRRKVYYYCISEDQERNLNAALALLSELEDQTAGIQKNNYIFLFSKDPALELMIDSVDKGMVEIDIINEYQMAAYSLLDRYPLPYWANKEKQINVLISGFGEMGQEFLRAVSWVGQIYGYTLSATVVGKNIEDRVSDFNTAYPGLKSERFRINFLSYRNEEQFRNLLIGQCEKCNYIVVTEESEATTIDRAVFLRRYYYGIDESFANKPPIFAYIENADKASAVANLRTAEGKPERRVSYDIVPFGMVTDIYTFQNITDSDLEKLSKNVHLVYEDAFGGPVDPDKAMRNYNMFEVNKRSNKANALHIRYKLLMMGYDYTDADDAEEIDYAQVLTQEKLDMLAYAEHSRWMSFLESEGWVTAGITQVKAYQASGLSKGRHNCPLLRMHPYICPAEELPARSKAMDLPDSTVYDRQMISRIPDILHDKWGVTGKRYKIVKAKRN